MSRAGDVHAAAAPLPGGLTRYPICAPLLAELVAQTVCRVLVGKPAFAIGAGTDSRRCSSGLALFIGRPAGRGFARRRMQEEAWLVTETRGAKSLSKAQAPRTLCRAADLLMRGASSRAVASDVGTAPAPLPGGFG